MMNNSENKTLPPELIMEILSRLHLKPLLRVQLVSKGWQALAHDHYFIQKHMVQSPVLHLWHNEYSGSSTTDTDSNKISFRFMHGCDGVLILMNIKSKTYFLWNPAIFRALELPSPHASIIGLVLLYVPATRDYRIVSIYKDKKTNSAGASAGAGGGVGCQVLTPGASMSWKHLPFPDVPKAEKVLVIPTGGDVHCVFVDKGDGYAAAAETAAVKMIVTLDVKAESFTVNHSAGEFGYAGTVTWDGKLGFSKIVGQTLELIKLEDYKKQTSQVEKTIIPLPFMNKPGFEGSVCPLFIRGSDIWFYLKGKEIFSYNIETGKVVQVKESKALSYESEQIYSYKPSLLYFEGMQPDTDTGLELYRPKINLT